MRAIRELVRVGLAAVLGAAGALVMPSGSAAQVNCAAVPAGPARTDCYIGQARIGGQKAAIAGTGAQLERDRAALGRATGQPAKGQRARTGKSRRPK